VYKYVALVKRKPGTTKEQFRDYYESTHSKLGEKYFPPYAIKYQRRYLEPMPSPLKPGQAAGPDYDCIAEFWFPDEANYRAFEASVAQAPEHERAAIIADEEAFVDRANTHRYLVIEEGTSFEPD
jgi:hypothetical protein